MSSTSFTRPDALVLAAGGILGEAWMSALLAGIERVTGVDFRRTERLVGTSAGAILAGTLSVGRRPSPPPGSSRGRDRARPGAGDTFAGAAEGENGAAQPGEPWRSRVGETALHGLSSAAWTAGAPLAPPALAVAAVGGALLRSMLLARAPEGTRTLDRVVEDFERAGARFDGRLRVCCVDRASGRRVVFGAPGAPTARVGEAVAASCAIPTVFRPVSIGGREYVDGGVWSLTNLDAATVARDTEVLCLNPTGNLPVETLSPYGALRAAFRAAEALETAALLGRGARVRIIAPDARAAAAMGVSLMNPGPRARVARAGYEQGLRIGRA